MWDVLPFRQAGAARRLGNTLVLKIKLLEVYAEFQYYYNLDFNSRYKMALHEHCNPFFFKETNTIAYTKLCSCVKKSLNNIRSAM